MKDYTLLQRWTPTFEDDFKDACYDFIDNPDISHYGTYNTLEDLVDELEYQGLNFNEIVQLTKNRYGSVIEIIEYASAFHVFIGAN